MTNKIKRNKKSLCEKTMQIAVNIIRVSSLSFAKKSLGTSAGLPRMIHGDHESGTIIEIESVSQGNEQRRLQEPVNSSKPSSYVLNPSEKKASSYVMRDGMNVDGRASDYIQRFHEKNRIHTADLKVSPYLIMPPPPPLIK
ncbi:hypothetical protein AQUCO_00200386v1 [Aquilegia coerulea]|uniref:Uncharacterized protein n=1 Tax=Aquilegia coerulea TaxID=218851 RepID=A0A2G5F2Y0_AQUCA|nr:hypothetical protein AQUCO_00200386v1 [Aquilegia coerulea]